MATRHALPHAPEWASTPNSSRSGIPDPKTLNAGVPRRTGGGQHAGLLALKHSLAGLLDGAACARAGQLVRRSPRAMLALAPRAQRRAQALEFQYRASGHHTMRQTWPISGQSPRRGPSDGCFFSSPSTTRLSQREARQVQPESITLIGDEPSRTQCQRPV